MKHTKIMGILNVTPDSFSDGGRFDKEDLVEVAGQMILDGAEILDIGGESTGPGSVDVSTEEELARTISAVQRVREAFPDVMISIDTWKSDVARAAVAAGANIINDVTAGRGDPEIAKVAADFAVPLVLMYSKDESPRTTTKAVEYEDVMATVLAFLKERVEWARERGVKQVIVDPGMGAFVSGDPKYSWEIIDRIEELDVLACPVLLGASRKSFLGEDRQGGTYLTSALLRGRADILRVHDVLENGTASL